MGDKTKEREAAAARAEKAKFERLAKMAENIKFNQKGAAENLRRASEITPEIAGFFEALQQDPTLMEKLETDPRFDEIARGNLEKIQEIAKEGGFTEEDMAKFKEAERKQKAQTAATLKSIDRQEMQRGAAPGSGLSYAAKQAAAQAAAQQGSSRMDQIALQAAERKRSALGQAAGMAQGQQGQQFQQSAMKAQAGDARALGNLNRQQVAQDRNLQLKQQLENVKAQQQAGYYQGLAGLEQQAFANEMSKIGVMSGAQGMASQYAMRGVAPKTNWGGMIGSAIGAGAGAYFGKGNPAAISAGASLGGSLGGGIANAADGGVFNDGGVKNKKQALEKMANKPSMNFSGMAPQSEEPSAADQIAAFNSLQRQGRAYNQGGVAQEVKKEEPKKESNNQMLDIISALADNLKTAKEGRNYSFGGGDFVTTPQQGEFNGVLAPQNNQQDPLAMQGIPSMAPTMDTPTTIEQAPKSNFVMRSRKDQNLPEHEMIADDFMAPEKPERTQYVTEKPMTESELDNEVTRQLADKKPEAKKPVKKAAKKEEKKEDKGEDLAKALGAIAGSVDKATNTGSVHEPIKNTLVTPEVKNYDFIPKLGPIGISAEDGAVKMSPEDMRDMLMSEVNAFACGGVKKDYEDGGISPELREATQMLRTNKPAPASPMPGGQPPMPADPNMMPPQAPQGAPMAPPMDPNMMPPQGAPMPPQGQMMADGGMAYEDGGEGTIIPGESYEGDELPDRINSGEMVLNVEQQDRLNDQLQELKRLKSKERTDKMLADGTAEVNPEQQEAIMSFVRGEIGIDELPSERVVKEPSVGEPTGRMAEFIGMLGKRRKG